MTRQNKFSGLKEALRGRQVESPTAPEHKETPPRAEEREEGRTLCKRKRGRPKGGKRSDPSFQQITLYMPSSLYIGVQKRLKQMRRSDGYEGPRDMSELVSSLVEVWNREV